MLQSGSTALHAAVLLGDAGCVCCLLDHGADVNLVTARGTALMTAARQGDCDMLRLLIHHGADLHTRDAGGDLVQCAACCTVIEPLCCWRKQAWPACACCSNLLHCVTMQHDVQGKQPGGQRCMLAVQCCAHMLSWCQIVVVGEC